MVMNKKKKQPIDVHSFDVICYPIETENGMEWTAEFPDVVGCVGGGYTYEEAIEEAYENLEFHLEALSEL